MPATTVLEAVRERAPEHAAKPAFERAPSITWFEIPAWDYEASVSFYEALLDAPMQRMIDPEMGRYAKFEGADLGTQGCVAPAQGRKPGADGALVFLWCGLELDPVLARAAKLGARIAEPKRMLPHGIGAVAQIVDPEGNRVGLHARR